MFLKDIKFLVNIILVVDFNDNLIFIFKIIKLCLNNLNIKCNLFQIYLNMILLFIDELNSNNMKIKVFNYFKI